MREIDILAVLLGSFQYACKYCSTQNYTSTDSFTCTFCWCKQKVVGKNDRTIN